MQFEQFFRLDKLAMTYVPDWQGIELADLLICHGHEIMAGGINPSQSTWNKTFCNTLIGHVHRTSSTTKKNGFKEFLILILPVVLLNYRLSIIHLLSIHMDLQ